VLTGRRLLAPVLVPTAIMNAAWDKQGSVFALALHICMLLCPLQTVLCKTGARKCGSPVHVKPAGLLLPQRRVLRLQTASAEWNMMAPDQQQRYQVVRVTHACPLH